MKKAFLTLATLMIFIFTVSPADAQTRWQVAASDFRDSSPDALVYVFPTHALGNSGWSTWSFAGITRGWGEVLAGISYNLTRGTDTVLEVGYGGGIEQPSFAYRSGASVYFQSPSEKVKALAFVEYGHESGWWYVSTVDVAVTDWLEVGAYSQRWAGTGPRISVTVPKTPATIRIAPVAYDLEDKTRGTSIVIEANF